MDEENKEKGKDKGKDKEWVKKNENWWSWYNRLFHVHFTHMQCSCMRFVGRNATALSSAW